MKIRLFFEFLAPSFANWQDCKILRKKIKDGTGSSPPSECIPLEEWTVAGLKELYESEKVRKEKFEDKAKTNVIGITISVTLIMGAYTLLQNVERKYTVGVIYWIAFTVFVMSVIYMLAAGLHAIHVITSDNVVHTPDPKKSEEEMKREYNLTIAMNRARDLIRNNHVYTSYECIRNSLFCLFVVMVIAVFPIAVGKAQTGAKVNSIYYSSQAIESLNRGINQRVVETIIDKQIRMGHDSGQVSTIDDTNHIFIKFSVDAGKVNVYLVEAYAP